MNAGNWDHILGSSERQTFTPSSGKFADLMDEHGRPIEVLLKPDGHFLSKTKFKKLGDAKPCNNHQFDAFKDWYQKHGAAYRQSLLDNGEKNQTTIQERSFDSLAGLNAALAETETQYRGGNQ
jgi:hypothetical protein